MGQRLQLAAGETRAAECLQAVAVRPIDGLQDVGAVARPTNSDQQIAWTREVLELLDEDAVETFVISPGEDVRRIVGKAQDAKTFLFVILEILPAYALLAEIFAEV